MNKIVFIAFIFGVFIYGYDGRFKGELSLLVAALIIIVSAVPIVFFQEKVKENRILMRLSLFGVVAGSMYLWFLTYGEILFAPKQ